MSRHPVRLLVRPSLRGPGGALLPNWLAITVGRTVVSWRPLDDAERAHELCHVRQWDAAGRIRYPVRYAAASVRAWRGGGHWYRDNAYEMEARVAADSVRAAADSVRAGSALASPAPPRPG